MSSTQQQQRPRSKSTFSFRSDKGGDVNGLNSKPIVNMKDAKRTEKKSRFGKQKSDPNKALAEQQPAMFSQSEEFTLGALKGHQYKDSLGNHIADPDATNPTRPRLERPLDTIRSFEAAIDTSFKRRTQMIRAESADAISSMMPSAAGGTKRTSMYLGNGPEPPFAPQSRYSPNHLANQSRNMSLRGGYDQYGGSQYGGSQYGGSQYGSRSGSYNTPNGGSMSRRPTGASRQYSAPFAQNRMSQDYSMYNAPHAYHESESRDTVNTGESSGSASEGWGQSTDPSSENSSIDRVHAIKQMDHESANAYGRGSPIHNTAIREEEDGRSLRQGYGYMDPYQPRRRSPPVAQPAPPPERKVIKFESSPAIAAEYAAENAAKMSARPETTKKKSWFGRKK